jgi:hypothetical protein
MSHRNIEYLHRRNIIYRRDPINDTPTEIFSWGKFYEEGTYECYELFRSKAKITTYKSFKWHILVLWHLNPKLDDKKFEDLVYFLADKQNGFVTFTIPEHVIYNIAYEVSKEDLEESPKNKIRKIIFKDNCGLTSTEKLKIVGTLMGKKKKAEESDIYEAMIMLHDNSKKITVKSLSKILNVSTRTIYRNITNDLNREKALLNEEIQHSKLC